jgi:hypothetical protein
MNWPAWRADLFDPRKVPFSRRDSFVAISWIEEDGAFWLRNLRGGDEHTDLGRMLRLEVSEPAEWSLTPDCLTAQGQRGVLRFSFDGPDRIVLAGVGLGLRLTAGASKYNYAQAATDHIHLCIARQDLRCNVAASTGVQHLDAVWNGLSSDAISIDLRPEQGVLAASFDLFRIRPKPASGASQPEAQARVAAEFSAFQTCLPQVPPEFSAGHLLASYILWSAYVPAEGALSLPSIYMSKNWMTNIWSWDHCFVALAFGQHAPEVAFEQMQAIFNAQDDSGRLPDYINDRYAYWAFTKPPVHGWTFAQLRAMAPNAYGPERLRQVLGWLEAQVGFWMSGPRLGVLPAYRHGNDAGWDNATCFAEGGPLASPDLATFLILQLDEIAALHRELGQPDQALSASQRGDALCKALCRDLWQETGFAARLATDGRVVQSGQSLLLYLPLLLGNRLTAEVRRTMLAQFFKPGRFLTANGLATEATDNPLYRANGYWRGPIWAPTTALFVDALHRTGQGDVADEVARRYCAMCNANGMSENHDALTGAGLHDPAFAWTSAVFLRMANSLLD